MFGQISIKYAMYDFWSLTKVGHSVVIHDQACFQQECFQDESGDTVCQLHLAHVSFNDLPRCHVATSGPGDTASCSCPGNILPISLLIAKLKGGPGGLSDGDNNRLWNGSWSGAIHNGGGGLHSKAQNPRLLSGSGCQVRLSLLPLHSSSFPVQGASPSLPSSR